MNGSIKGSNWTKILVNSEQNFLVKSKLLGSPTITVSYSLNDYDQLSLCRSLGMHDLSINDHFQVLNCDVETVAIDPNGRGRC
jgi:hypothetical protein